MFPDYACIREVGSFEELVSTPFANRVNAHCWVRSLAGDFNEIVNRLDIRDEIATLEGEALQDLELSDSGKIARDALIEDQRLLSEFGLSPMLDCIPAYPRDPDAGAVPTDVYSYHVHSATAEADTYLCSYNEASSEGLRNEDALRRIDIPETRAALLDQYGGKDDTGFLAYLKDNFLDLHYMPILKAKPYTFGLGNLWRIATQYPGSPVPPCIHRAPTTSPGRPSRLLLIS